MPASGRLANTKALTKWAAWADAATTTGAPGTTPRITEQARCGAGGERPAVLNRHRDTVVDVARICDGYSSPRGVTVEDGVHIRTVQCLVFFQKADEMVEGIAVRGKKIGRPMLGFSQ
jgi:hypothetical protein